MSGKKAYRRKRSERVADILDWQLWGPFGSSPDWWHEDATPEQTESRKAFCSRRFSTVERPLMFTDSRPGALGT